MKRLKEFKNHLGPVLGETFDYLIEDMIHDGAQAPVENIDRKIKVVKKKIDEVNAKRQVLSETKSAFNTIYKQLKRFIKEKEYNSLELTMLKLVLKDRIRLLERQIDETRPDRLLKEKSLLKERKSFLIENRKLAFELYECLDG